MKSINTNVHVNKNGWDTWTQILGQWEICTSNTRKACTKSNQNLILKYWWHNRIVSDKESNIQEVSKRDKGNWIQIVNSSKQFLRQCWSILANTSSEMLFSSVMGLCLHIFLLSPPCEWFYWNYAAWILEKEPTSNSSLIFLKYLWPMIWIIFTARDSNL